MTLKSFVKRLIVLWMLVCFVTTSHMLPPAFAQASQSSMATGSGQLAKDVTAIHIPESIGEIQEYYRGSKDKFFVLIQDAHSIPDAQNNIRALIDFFQKRYSVDLTLAEGSSSAFDSKFLKSFPDKEILKEKFKEYMVEGEVTGAVTASIFNEREGIYHGVEDWQIYEEGIRLYLKALDQMKVVEDLLNPIKRELNGAKQNTYSLELFSIDESVSLFRENKVTLIDLLKALEKHKSPPRGSKIETLLQKVANESQSTALLDIEVKKIAEKVKSTLNRRSENTNTRDDLEEFNQLYQEFFLSQLSSEAFGLYLKKVISKYRIPVEISQTLSQSVESEKRLRDIQGTELFRDIENYIKETKTFLMDSERQRLINAESERLYRLQQLSKMELTQEGWSEVKAHSGSLMEWSLKLDGIVPSDKYAKLISALEPHIRFYEIAELRDQVLLEKSISVMDQYQRQESILITGGFHAEGLTRALKRKGISYLLVMPKISQMPQIYRYKDHMKGDVPWKSYFEVDRQGRINLYDGFMRGTRDELLEMSSESRGRILKTWRDQIIRALASEGNVVKARKYLRFLDEVAGDNVNSKIDIGEKWLEQIDQFIRSLRGLESKGLYDQKNILNLIQTSRAAVIAHASASSPNDSVSMNLLRSVIPKSELRSLEQEFINAELHRSEIRNLQVTDLNEAVTNARRLFSEIGIPSSQIGQNITFQLTEKGLIDNENLSREQINALKTWHQEKFGYSFDGNSIDGGSRSIMMPDFESFVQQTFLHLSLWPQINKKGEVQYLMGKGAGVEMAVVGQIQGREKHESPDTIRTHSDFELYGTTFTEESKDPNSDLVGQPKYPTGYQEVFNGLEVFPVNAVKAFYNLPVDPNDKDFILKNHETVDFGGIEILIPRLELLFLDKYFKREMVTDEIAHPDGFDFMRLARSYDLDLDIVVHYFDRFYTEDVRGYDLEGVGDQNPKLADPLFLEKTWASLLETNDIANGKSLIKGSPRYKKIVRAMGSRLFGIENKRDDNVYVDKPEYRALRRDLEAMVNFLMPQNDWWTMQARNIFDGYRARLEADDSNRVISFEKKINETRNQLTQFLNSVRIRRSELRTVNIFDGLEFEDIPSDSLAHYIRYMNIAKSLPEPEKNNPHYYRNLEPQRLDSLIEAQAESDAQALKEWVSNGIDATLGEKRKIGRFGIGFLQSLNFLAEEEGLLGNESFQNSISIRTETEEGEAHSVKLHRGDLGKWDMRVGIEETEALGNKGTEMSILWPEGLASDRLARFQDALLSGLHLQRAVPIYVNGQLINPLDDYLFVNGDRVQYIDPNERIDITLNKNKFSVRDYGSGMSLDEIRNKLLIPRIGGKGDGLVKTQSKEDVIQEVAFFYKAPAPLDTKMETMQVRIQVSGVLVQSFDVEGVNLPKELILDLPSGTSLSLSRNEVQIDEITHLAVEAFAEKIVQSGIIHQDALINGFMAVVAWMDEKNKRVDVRASLVDTARNIILPYIDHWMSKQEDKGQGNLILPNQFEFMYIDVPHGTRFLDPSLHYDIHPSQVEGWDSIENFEKGSVSAAFAVPFKSKGDAKSFLIINNILLINKDYLNRHEDFPLLLNLALNFYVGYGPRSKDKGHLIRLSDYEKKEAERLVQVALKRAENEEAAKSQDAWREALIKESSAFARMRLSQGDVESLLDDLKAKDFNMQEGLNALEYVEAFISAIPSDVILQNFKLSSLLFLVNNNSKLLPDTDFMRKEISFFSNPENKAHLLYYFRNLNNLNENDMGAFDVIQVGDYAMVRDDVASSIVTFFDTDLIALSSLEQETLELMKETFAKQNLDAWTDYYRTVRELTATADPKIIPRIIDRWLRVYKNDPKSAGTFHDVLAEIYTRGISDGELIIPEFEEQSDIYMPDVFQFKEPIDIATGRNGDVFVLDKDPKFGGAVVKVLDRHGEDKYSVGGIFSPTPFNQARHISVDPNDNILYVVDGERIVMVKLDSFSEDEFSVEMPGIIEDQKNVLGIDVDAEGQLYVLRYSEHGYTVEKVFPSHRTTSNDDLVLTTILRQRADSPSASQTLPSSFSANNLAYDKSSKTLLFVDVEAGGVTRVDMKDGEDKVIRNDIGKLFAEDFATKYSLTVDGQGNIYLKRNGSYRSPEILIFDRDGNAIGTVENDGGNTQDTSITIDESGRLLTVENKNIGHIALGLDPEETRVKVFAPKHSAEILEEKKLYEKTQILGTLESISKENPEASYVSGMHSLSRPRKTVHDSEGNIYVLDDFLGNQVIKRYTSAGKFLGMIEIFESGVGEELLDMAIDKTRDILYVLGSGGREIYVFKDLNNPDEVETKFSNMPVAFKATNISVDPNGYVVVFDYERAEGSKLSPTHLSPLDDPENFYITNPYYFDDEIKPNLFVDHHGSIYISDPKARNIVVVDVNPDQRRLVEPKGAGEHLSHFVVDAEENIIVTYADGNSVLFDRDGHLLQRIEAMDEQTSVSGVSIDLSGDILVSDRRNPRLIRHQREGSFNTDSSNSDRKEVLFKLDENFMRDRNLLDIEVLGQGLFVVITEHSDEGGREAHLYESVGESSPTLTLIDGVLAGPKYVHQSLSTGLFYISDNEGIKGFNREGEIIGRIPTNKMFNKPFRFAIKNNLLAIDISEKDNENIVLLMDISEGPLKSFHQGFLQYPAPIDVAAIAFNHQDELVVVDKLSDSWVIFNDLENNSWLVTSRDKATESIAFSQLQDSSLMFDEKGFAYLSDTFEGTEVYDENLESQENFLSDNFQIDNFSGMSQDLEGRLYFVDESKPGHQLVRVRSAETQQVYRPRSRTGFAATAENDDLNGLSPTARNLIRFLTEEDSVFVQEEDVDPIPEDWVEMVDYVEAIESDDISLGKMNLLFQENASRLKSAEIAQSGLSPDEFITFLLELEGRNTKHLEDQIRSGTFGQDKAERVWIREKGVQNPITAIAKARESGLLKEDEGSVEHRNFLNGENWIYSMRDPVGMSLWQLLRFYFPIDESDARGSDTGKFGQGNYTIFSDFDEVLIRTSPLDPTDPGHEFVQEVKIIRDPIRGPVITSWKTFKKSEPSSFTGTEIRRIKKIDGSDPQLESLFIQEALERFAGLIRTPEMRKANQEDVRSRDVKITLNSELIHEDVKFLSSSSMPLLGGFAEVQILRSKRPVTRAAQDGIHVKTPDQKELALVPKRLWKRLSARGALQIVVPHDIPLTIPRNAYTKEQLYLEDLQKATLLATMKAALRDHVYSGMELIGQPPDYFGRQSVGLDDAVAMRLAGIFNQASSQSELNLSDISIDELRPYIQNEVMFFELLSHIEFPLGLSNEVVTLEEIRQVKMSKLAGTGRFNNERLKTVEKLLEDTQYLHSDNLRSSLLWAESRVKKDLEAKRNPLLNKEQLLAEIPEEAREMVKTFISNVFEIMNFKEGTYSYYAHDDGALARGGGEQMYFNLYTMKSQLQSIGQLLVDGGSLSEWQGVLSEFIETVAHEINHFEIFEAPGTHTHHSQDPEAAFEDQLFGNRMQATLDRLVAFLKPIYIDGVVAYQLQPGYQESTVSWDRRNESKRSELRTIETVVVEPVDSDKPNKKNEDAYVDVKIKVQIPGRDSTLEGRLSAVFDGHGGDEVSSMAQERFPQIFKETLESHAQSNQVIDYGQVLEDAVESLEESITSELLETSMMEVGATLTAIYYPDEENVFYSAILGDSPLLIIDEKGNQIRQKIQKFDKDDFQFKEVGERSWWESPNHNLRYDPEEFEKVGRRILEVLEKRYLANTLRRDLQELYEKVTDEYEALVQSGKAPQSLEVMIAQYFANERDVYYINPFNLSSMGLQMSRSLADMGFKRVNSEGKVVDGVSTAKPVITRHDLSEYEGPIHVVLTTDGFLGSTNLYMERLYKVGVLVQYLRFLGTVDKQFFAEMITPIPSDDATLIYFTVNEDTREVIELDFENLQTQDLLDHVSKIQDTLENIYLLDYTPKTVFDKFSEKLNELKGIQSILSLRNTDVRDLTSLIAITELRLEASMLHLSITKNDLLDAIREGPQSKMVATETLHDDPNFNIEAVEWIGPKLEVQKRAEKIQIEIAEMTSNDLIMHEVQMRVSDLQSVMTKFETAFNVQDGKYDDKYYIKALRSDAAAFQRFGLHPEIVAYMRESSEIARDNYLKAEAEQRKAEAEADVEFLIQFQRKEAIRKLSPEENAQAMTQQDGRDALASDPFAVSAVIDRMIIRGIIEVNEGQTYSYDIDGTDFSPLKLGSRIHENDFVEEFSAVFNRALELWNQNVLTPEQYNDLSLNLKQILLLYTSILGVDTSLKISNLVKLLLLTKKWQEDRRKPSSTTFSNLAQDFFGYAFSNPETENELPQSWKEKVKTQNYRRLFENLFRSELRSLDDSELNYRKLIRTDELDEVTILVDLIESTSPFSDEERKIFEAFAENNIVVGVRPGENTIFNEASDFSVIAGLFSFPFEGGPRLINNFYPDFFEESSKYGVAIAAFDELGQGNNRFAYRVTLSEGDASRSFYGKVDKRTAPMKKNEKTTSTMDEMRNYSLLRSQIGSFDELKDLPFTRFHGHAEVGSSKALKKTWEEYDQFIENMSAEELELAKEFQPQHPLFEKRWVQYGELIRGLDLERELMSMARNGINEKSQARLKFLTFALGEMVGEFYKLTGGWMFGDFKSPNVAIKNDPAGRPKIINIDYEVLYVPDDQRSKLETTVSPELITGLKESFPDNQLRDEFAHVPLKFFPLMLQKHGSFDLKRKSGMASELSTTQFTGLFLAAFLSKFTKDDALIQDLQNRLKIEFTQEDFETANRIKETADQFVAETGNITKSALHLLDVDEVETLGERLYQIPNIELGIDIIEEGSSLSELRSQESEVIDVEPLWNDLQTGIQALHNDGRLANYEVDFSRRNEITIQPLAESRQSGEYLKSSITFDPDYQVLRFHQGIQRPSIGPIGHSSTLSISRDSSHLQASETSKDRTTGKLSMNRPNLPNRIETIEVDRSEGVIKILLNGNDRISPYYFQSVAPFIRFENRSELRAHKEFLTKYLEDLNPNGIFEVTGDLFTSEGYVSERGKIEVKQAINERKALMIDVASLISGPIKKLESTNGSALINDNRMESMTMKLRTLGVYLEVILGESEREIQIERFGKWRTHLVIRELFKNAIYHGNRLNLDFPVALNIKLEGDRHVAIEAFDFGLASIGIVHPPHRTFELSGWHEFKKELLAKTEYRLVNKGEGFMIEPETVFTEGDLKINKVSVVRSEVREDLFESVMTLGSDESRNELRKKEDREEAAYLLELLAGEKEGTKVDHLISLVVGNSSVSVQDQFPDYKYNSRTKRSPINFLEYFHEVIENAEGVEKTLALEAMKNSMSYLSPQSVGLKNAYDMNELIYSIAERAFTEYIESFGTNSEVNTHAKIILSNLVYKFHLLIPMLMQEMVAALKRSQEDNDLDHELSEALDLILRQRVESIISISNEDVQRFLGYASPFGMALQGIDIEEGALLFGLLGSMQEYQHLNIRAMIYLGLLFKNDHASAIKELPHDSDLQRTLLLIRQEFLEKLNEAEESVPYPFKDMTEEERKEINEDDFFNLQNEFSQKFHAATQSVLLEYIKVVEIVLEGQRGPDISEFRKQLYLSKDRAEQLKIGRWIKWFASVGNESAIRSLEFADRDIQEFIEAEWKSQNLQLDKSLGIESSDDRKELRKTLEGTDERSELPSVEIESSAKQELSFDKALSYVTRVIDQSLWDRLKGLVALKQEADDAEMSLWVSQSSVEHVESTFVSTVVKALAESLPVDGSSGIIWSEEALGVRDVETHYLIQQLTRYQDRYHSLALFLPKDQKTLQQSSALSKLVEALKSGNGRVNEVIVNGKLSAVDKNRLESEAGVEYFRSAKMNRSIMTMNDQASIPLLVIGAIQNAVHSMFAPFRNDISEDVKSDPVTIDYVELLRAVAAIHYADIVSQNKAILADETGETLRAELLSRLERFGGAFEQIIQKDGSGWTIKGTVARAYLEMRVAETMAASA